MSLGRYGGRHTVTMMPGDGIGPEMMGYVKEVFSLVGAPVDFEEIKMDPNTGVATRVISPIFTLFPPIPNEVTWRVNQTLPKAKHTLLC